jgi:hypothetical protein
LPFKIKDNYITKSEKLQIDKKLERIRLLQKIALGGGAAATGLAVAGKLNDNKYYQFLLPPALALTGAYALLRNKEEKLKDTKK